MIVKYLKQNNKEVDLTNGNDYKVMSIERGWYRIIDDSGEDYLYPPESFEVVDDTGRETLIKSASKSKKYDDTYFKQKTEGSIPADNIKLYF